MSGRSLTVAARLAFLSPLGRSSRFLRRAAFGGAYPFAVEIHEADDAVEIIVHAPLERVAVHFPLVAKLVFFAVVLAIDGERQLVAEDQGVRNGRLALFADVAAAQRASGLNELESRFESRPLLQGHLQFPRAGDGHGR